MTITARALTIIAIAIGISVDAHAAALVEGKAGPWLLGTSELAAKKLAENRHWRIKRSELSLAGKAGKIWLTRWQLDPEIGTYRRFVLFFVGKQLIRIKAYYREVSDVSAAAKWLKRSYGTPSWRRQSTAFWIRGRRLGASLQEGIGLLQWVDLTRALALGLLTDGDLQPPEAHVAGQSPSHSADITTEQVIAGLLRLILCSGSRILVKPLGVKDVFAARGPLNPRMRRMTNTVPAR